MSEANSSEDPNQDARLSRLSLRKANEEVFRNKLRYEARVKCDSYVKAFGDCAKENGLMVVFRCRDKSKQSM